MKFSCTQENLNRGLSIVSHVATRNVSLPILNNVLIQAEPGSIKLSATNLEIGVRCLLRGKVERAGRFTVNGKLFADYVALLPKDRVDVSLDGTALHVTSPGSKTTIRGASADEFPVIPEVKRDHSMKVPGADVKAAITRVIFAAAADEARPEISGVLIQARDKTLTLAATDSYRLAEQRLDLPQAVGREAKVILPSRSLQEVLRTLGDEPVELILEENQALFAYDDVELTTRLIEGRYPDYAEIIPASHETTLEVGRGELINAVKQASLFCKHGVYDVTLESDGEKKLVVRAANTQAGEHETELTVKGTGGATSIVFNYRYLLDGLGAMPTDTVVLELGSSSSPGLLRSKGARGGLYLIMPIRQ
ncbi:MAG: DNA polymerase III subunit beta [Candidatus Kerfeldbacteria bacterium]|nr:DNA polymerase III subunit beta [Candidatus Kerfeldbacteria bacterium]